jgi:hypothetical protein
MAIIFIVVTEILKDECLAADDVISAQSLNPYTHTLGILPKDITQGNTLNCPVGLKLHFNH